MVIPSCSSWEGDPAELERLKQLSVQDLIAHILDRYHTYARIELVGLETLIEEALRLEGHRASELSQISQIFKVFASDLREHMKWEEEDLFPFMLAVTSGNAAASMPLDASSILTKEHDATAGMLEDIYRLTSGFTASGESRLLLRKLFRNFDFFATSLRQHVYVENEILLPHVFSNVA